MKVCKVVGNVVSTCKHPSFEGKRLLVVQPLDENGKDQGQSFLAVDRAQAGPGDTVLVMREGTGVRQILEAGPQTPIRSLIVGIVDHVELS
jgi:microcompartment protein CcmK/EutM